MGREKKGGPGVGSSAKDRHKRDRKGNVIDWTAPLPPGLNARPEKPKLSSKHKSYLEWVENKNKKKKLEFEFTEDRHPPPGFEFVPIGNPALTTACKELSREQGAMIFIVTSTFGRFSRTLSFQLNRAGHHIRQSIVEEARKSLGDAQDTVVDADPGVPEPIPEKQEDIDKQADAAIRDLFPRIPNTDRQMIIQHAFNKANLNPKKGDAPPVGLAPDIPLSRRVQLAVLAHIRHTHTRYDELLRETSYVNARKAVEKLCLEYLVKWRGDEETGRDQLDEILCEVVVISDSESDEENDESDSDSSGTGDSEEEAETERSRPSNDPGAVSIAGMPELAGISNGQADTRLRVGYAHAGRKAKIARRDRRAAIMKAQRKPRRYEAARDKAWQEAVERQHQQEHRERLRSATVMSVDGPDGNRQQWRSQEPANRKHAVVVPSSLGAPAHRPEPYHGDAWPIVGPRTVVPGAQQAPRPPLDLRDHLVRSIEPASPQSPYFPSPFPGHQQIKPEHGGAYVYRPDVKPTFHQGEARACPQAAPPRGFQVVEDPGFITIRSRDDQMPAAPAQQSRAPMLSTSRSEVMRNGYIPIDLTGDHSPRPSSYRKSPGLHQGRPILRSEKRPIWVEDDEPIYGSGSRPIFPQGSWMPAAQAVTTVPEFSQDRRSLPFKQESYPPAPTNRDDNGARFVSYRDPRSDQVVSDDNIVEIVRVTNKFPRQHDQPAFTMDQGRHEIRPGTQQGYEHVRALHEPAPYGFAPGAPLPPRRIERVVSRIEEPVYYKHEDRFGANRYPDGQSERPQREERVVGIEYVSVPTPNNHDARFYSDQHPISRYVEAERVIHQQEAQPVMQRTYPGDEQMRQPQEPDDGFITLYRRA